MRANSHDYGEPTDQIISDFAEHSHNCQTARTKTLIELECRLDRLHRILTRILSKQGLHTPAVNISVTMNEVNGTKTTEELIEFLWEEMDR